MTLPVYNVYGNHPRVLFRDTDKTALTARTNSASSWQTLWDNTIVPRADTLKAATDQANGESTVPHMRWLVLALVGWIEETGRPVNGYKDKAIKAALWLAAAQPPNPSNAYERYILIGFSLVFDICYDDMTAGERTTIANQIDAYCGNMSADVREKMDGWSGNDSMCRLLGGLAIHGHHSSAQGHLDGALTFLYGAAGDPTGGRLDMARFCNDGNERGGTYLGLAYLCELWTLWVLDNATDLDPFTDESAWASKQWEWIIWDQYRGNVAKDWDAHGDTGHITNPVMLVETRYFLAILATKYPNTGGLQGGQMLRWLYDQYDGFQSANAENQIFDVIFLDRAAVTPVHPKDATTPVPHKRLFSPPGTFYYRKSAVGTPDWDFENSVKFRVNAKKFRWLGHFHPDAGSVQITFKGDVLLQAPAGSYGGGGITRSSTAHYNNALQRSWLQSLSPMILDPAAVYTHGSISSVNDGGQQLRKYIRDGVQKADPENIFWMQSEGGGLGWVSVESFTKIFDTADMCCVRANMREGYKRFYTDPQRCPILEAKYLFIPPTAANGLTYPAMLYYCRIKKADQDWVAQIPMHAYGAITTTAYGAHWTGYNANNSISPAGKLWVDIRNVGDYTLTNNTPGTITNGYGANQFKVAGAGTNFVPTGSTNAREARDMKNHSLYWKKTAPVEEEHYVAIFMPTASADSEPVPTRAWVTDGAQPNYYGIVIGSNTYLVHRTLDQAVFGGTDTTAPANVTGAAVAARELALLATWTDPADSDYDHADVEYRTSAT